MDWLTRERNRRDKDGGPYGPDQVLRVVQQNGSDRWYAIGREMGYATSQLESTVHSLSEDADKLLAIFKRKCRDENENKAALSLLKACRDMFSPLLGHIERDLPGVCAHYNLLPKVSPGGPYDPDQVFSVVQQCGPDWYSIGCQMGYTDSQLESTVHGRHLAEEKLSAIFQQKCRDEGDHRAALLLLKACRDIHSPVIGAIEDELPGVYAQYNLLPKVSSDHTLDAVVIHGSSRWRELGKAMGFAVDEAAAITELKTNDEDKLKELITSKLVLAGRADVRQLLMDACKIIDPPIIKKVKREIHVKEATVTLVVEKDEDVDLLLTVLTKHLRVEAVELGNQLGMSTERVSELTQGSKSDHERLKRIFASIMDKKQLSRHQVSRLLIAGFSRTCIDDLQFEVMLEELVFVLARQTASFTKEDMSLFKRELAKGYVQIGRARINVVGQDRCGKTCFIRALLKLLFERQKSTEGTAIDLVTTEAENWHKLTNDGQKLTTLDRCIVEAALPDDSDVDATEEDLGKAERAGDGYGDTNSSGTQSLSSTKELNEDKNPASSDTVPSKSKMEFNDVLKDEAKRTRRLIKKYVRKGIRKLPADRGFRIIYSIWDHGGQEPYLPAHCALLDDYAVFSCGIYIIVFDQSKLLSDEAESYFCSDPSKRGKKLKLCSMKLNKDHVAHWLTQITLAAAKHAQFHEHLGDERMGSNVGVVSPPVFFVGTHDDHKDAEKNRTQQNDILNGLIDECRSCEKHCVSPEKDTNLSFFRVNNTKSGVKGQDPAKEVRELIDRITEAYWTQPGCKKAQPVSYLVLEKMLTLYKKMTLERQEKGGHICDKEVFDQLATELCGIKSHGTATALKYFSTLGIVLHYPEVKGSRGSSFTAGLKDKIFIDPQWISRLASKFGTCKEPQQRVREEWRKVQSSGVMAWKLVDYFLNEDDIRVSEEERKPALTVLCLLDILCPKDGDIASLGEREMDFYVPGLLLKIFEDPCKWQSWTEDGGLPPPLVLAPVDVRNFPETLFFRLVVRALQRYPTNPQLRRNRCLVHAVNESGCELDLELVYYDRRCVLVTVAFATVQTSKADDFDIRVRQHCEQLQKFILENLDDAKMRGMAGFSFEPRISPHLPLFLDNCDGSLDDLVSIRGWRPFVTLYSPGGDRVSDKSASLFARWFEAEKVTPQLTFDGTEVGPYRSSVATVTRTKFIDVVIRNGLDKSYLFGSELHYNHAQLNCLTYGHVSDESKLRAIIEEAKRGQGIQKTVDDLVAICDKLQILGGVKDDLKIKMEDEIIFVDDLDTPPSSTTRLVRDGDVKENVIWKKRLFIGCIFVAVASIFLMALFYPER